VEDPLCSFRDRAGDHLPGYLTAPPLPCLWLKGIGRLVPRDDSTSD
jgi:hypothetical protein